jgi:hypothetical protein
MAELSRIGNSLKPRPQEQRAIPKVNSIPLEKDMLSSTIQLQIISLSQESSDVHQAQARSVVG